MNFFLALFLPLTLVLGIGYLASSAKIINQGHMALVERLGKYKKTLKPGLHFIVPFVDRIAVQDTDREQILDIKPQQAFTKDTVPVTIDAVVYWKIENLWSAYYQIDDVRDAIGNIVNTSLRTRIGEMTLEESFSSLAVINEHLTERLNKDTQDWGIAIRRVEVQNLDLPSALQQSMEEERAAKLRKQASITESEGVAESMGRVFEAIQKQSTMPMNTSEVLKFLIAQKYVQASQDLGQSPNAKVVFMDPKALSDAISDLMEVSKEPNPPAPQMRPEVRQSPPVKRISLEKPNLPEISDRSGLSGV
ncbi:MAG: SPFH/Band 7/PHB domain protein [Oscillatoria sp. SIO1A7]|nr:SPFH/Band 7/PHB domain protein [Oscillatoria sp. SIO1A7]